jgi:hypothetical protein
MEPSTSQVCARRDCVTTAPARCLGGNLGTQPCERNVCVRPGKQKRRAVSTSANPSSFMVAGPGLNRRRRSYAELSVSNKAIAKPARSPAHTRWICIEVLYRPLNAWLRDEHSSHRVVRDLTRP